MSMYTIPADTKEKEKVIGGYLTTVQFFWLLGGLVLGLGLFVLFFGMTGSLFIGLFFLLIGLGLSIPFVFVKKKELTLFQYLKYKRRLKKRQVYLPNKKKEMIK